jgi:putative ABC transport system permease protein
MRTLLRIAARNLLRQRRRSALTGASIVLGVACALFAMGFLGGFADTLIRLSVDSQIGAIQIHKRGYADADEPLKFDLPDDASIRDTVMAVPNVLAMAPRINFEGLLNNGKTASVLFGTAVDKKKEMQVCPGREAQLGTAELAGDDIVLGDEMATTLDLKVGSNATLLAASQRGASNALDVGIEGLLEVKIPLAAKMVGVVSVPFAQRLLRMPGRVTEYALSVKDLREVKSTAAAVQSALGDAYEVETWREREPQAAAGVDRFTVIIGIIVIILFLLVGSSVVNSMLMSVQERVREIGTMMAVGLKRRQVLAIVLAEAGVLAVGAAVLGTIIGIAIVSYLGSKGVVFQLKGAKPLEIYPRVTAVAVIRTVIGAEIGALLSALYPAFKASRLSPVEALRTV